MWLIEGISPPRYNMKLIPVCEVTIFGSFLLIYGYVYTNMSFLNDCTINSAVSPSRDNNFRHPCYYCYIFPFMTTHWY
jgi:hypothetical protein